MKLGGQLQEAMYRALIAEPLVAPVYDRPPADAPLPATEPALHHEFGTRIAGLAWQRDAVDPYRFHVQVPSGVSELAVEFQYLSEVQGQGGRVVMTREMLNLQWISQVLYPGGLAVRDIPVQASVTLPAGWPLASALRVTERKAGPEGETWHFEKTSLETLADSPLFAGRYHQQIALDPQGTAQPVVLNLFADAPEQLKASDEQIEAHRQLVRQTDLLMGARHFRH